MPDVQSTVENVVRAAEAGGAVAQYDLAVLYDQGLGVDASPEKACEWYTRSAASEADAPDRVWARAGDCYMRGVAVARNEGEATRMYRIGAARGSAAARYQLALNLQEGLGVAVDAVEAFRVFNEAAAQDHAGATLQVAFCYAQGRGVARDAAAATDYYERYLAHPRRHPEHVNIARYNLGLAYVKGTDGFRLDVARGTTLLHEAADAGYALAKAAVQKLEASERLAAAARGAGSSGGSSGSGSSSGSGGGRRKKKRT